MSRLMHRLTVSAASVAMLSVALVATPAAAATISGAPVGGMPTGGSLACLPGAADRPAGVPSREGDPSALSAAEVRAFEAQTAELLAARPGLAQRAREGTDTRRRIDVAVHVIRPDKQTVEVRRHRAERAIKLLNRAYKGGQSDTAFKSTFRFRMTSFDSAVNPKWYDADVLKPQDRPVVRRMKRALHQGGPDTLNLYLSRPEFLLGWATFPQEYKDFPNLDGVVVNIGSLAGGEIEGYNLGDTVPHEVGHWLGLYHTFQDGCSRLNDRVSDTAPEASPNFRCEKGRDTCVEDDFNDPIHNFMDYSYDRCMNKFTQGQHNRMVLHWLAWRK